MYSWVCARSKRPLAMVLWRSLMIVVTFVGVEQSYAVAGSPVTKFVFMKTSAEPFARVLSSVVPRP